MPDAVVEDVLKFWLGERPDEAATVAEKRRWWFAGGDAFDEEVRARFGSLVADVAKGSLAPWLSSHRGRLAAVIVLDQFSRNIYRGTARAFAQDLLAQRITEEGLATGADAALGVIECAFFCFPLHHAEKLELQRRFVTSMEALRARSPVHLREIVNGFHESGVEHCTVIERFGRFPHRNGVLGRESTLEERAYLEGGASRYGQ